MRVKALLSLLLIFVLFFLVFYFLESHNHIFETNQPIRFTFSNAFAVLYVLLLPFIGFFCAKKSSKSTFAHALIFIGISIYFHFHILLMLYKMTRHIDFDIQFITYNRAVVFVTIERLFGYTALAILGFCVLLLSRFLYLTYRDCYLTLPAWPMRRFIRLSIYTLFSASVIFNILSYGTVHNGLFRFIKLNVLSPASPIKNYYLGRYHHHIQERIQTNTASEISPGILLGYNIIFLHLESVNHFLVNDTITPQLMRAAQNGIKFSLHYSNTVQTTRAIDVILCGTPPSLDHSLFNNYSRQQLQHLLCLPRILQHKKYQTLFFSADTPDFDHTGEFAESIGFQNVFHEDFMSSNAVKQKWGFRDDFFYEGSFRFLKSSLLKQPFFAYFAVGAVNHYPFSGSDAEVRKPYPKPQSFQEMLANSTHLQDHYMKIFLDEYFKHFADNTALIIFSDHSYPMGEHPNNTSNEAGVFEENFRVPFIFIPPKNLQNKFSAPFTSSSHPSSHMDILPTFLDLLGLKTQPGLLGHSLSGTLLTDAPQDHKKHPILLTQPFSENSLILLDYPKKHVLNLRSNQFKIMDLENDPRELHPHEAVNIDWFASAIESYFNRGSKHT